MKDEQALWLPWGMSDGEGIWCWLEPQHVGMDPQGPLHPQVGIQQWSGVLMGLWGCCLPAGQLPPHALCKPTPPIEMPQFFGRHLIV